MADRNDRALEFAARMEKHLRSPKERLTPPEVIVDRLQAPVGVAISGSRIDAAVDQAEELAAVSGRFRPDDLAPLLHYESLRVAVLSRLSPLCSVETSGQDTFWLLRIDRRLAVLKRLFDEGRLALLLLDRLPATDRFGEMLRTILKFGDAIELEGLSQDDLLAVSSALEALQDLPIPKPALSSIQKRLARTRFLAEYDVLLDRFLGREPELSRLAEFLARPGTGRQCVLLTGFGGAGKSTLLAKFAVETSHSGKATVVVLDFDRPGIDANDTEGLEMEMARQVGVQFPDFDQFLRDTREDARRFRVSDQVEQYAADHTEGLRGSRGTVLDNIYHVLQSTTLRPMLLVLDTFEEVIQRDLAGRILEWVSDLETHIQPFPLRVVISGRLFDRARAGLKRYLTADDINVDEFDVDTARRFLISLGLPETPAERLATSDLLARRPLELKLLARLVLDGPATSIDEIEREVREGGDKARDLFAGLVYRRVLLRLRVGEQDPRKPRISDETLQALAYPGLVLRYVTAELIQKVLVPALELSALDDDTAGRALDILAGHEWLAYTRDGEVWHRKELRRSVLKAMIAKEPDKARKVQLSAIAYFQDAPTAGERAEAVYHRLMMLRPEDDAGALTLDIVRRAASSFEADQADLPPTGSALLRYAMSGGVSVEDLPLLPRDIRSRAYHDKGELLVNDREFGTARRLYQASDSPLAYWERRTLVATADWELLRQRLTPDTSTHSVEELGQFVFSAALTGVLSVDDLAKVLDRAWIAKMSTVATPLQLLAVGTVMLSGGRSLPADARQALIRVLELTSRMTDRDQIAGKRLALLGLLVSEPVTKGLPLAPGTVCLNPTWLRRASELLDGQHLLTTRVGTLLDAVSTTLQQSSRGRWTVHTVLSAVQQIRASTSVTLDWNKADRDTLWHLFRAPDPEFRDPARFALLEAFQGPESYASLAGLFTAAIPFELDGLQPEAFTVAVSPDPEHALEAYVELADRAGVLDSLLEAALKLHPASRKLQTVLAALRQWHDSARQVVFAR